VLEVDLSPTGSICRDTGLPVTAWRFGAGDKSQRLDATCMLRLNASRHDDDDDDDADNEL